MCLARDRCTSATYVCQDCKVSMCDSCQEYHLKIDIFTAHIVTPLETGAILCSAHNHSIEYLCLECKKNLCLHCTMHSSHESHTNQIKTLESAQEDMIDQAQKMRYVMEGIQKSSISLMYQPSLMAEDFSLDILILTMKHILTSSLTNGQSYTKRCKICMRQALICHLLSIIIT